MAVDRARKWRLLAGNCADRRRVHRGLTITYLLGALKCRRECGALTEVLRRRDRWVVTHVGAWSCRDGLRGLNYVAAAGLVTNGLTIRLVVTDCGAQTERKTARRRENDTCATPFVRKGKVCGRLASERIVLSRGNGTAQASAIGCAAVLVRKLARLIDDRRRGKPSRMRVPKVLAILTKFYSLRGANYTFPVLWCTSGRNARAFIPIGSTRLRRNCHAWWIDRHIQKWNSLIMV